MNKLIALLLFAQFLCFTAVSQTPSVKASKACPSWNPKNNKSDYADLSKRSSAKSTKNFATPKYQSIYAKNTVTTQLTRGQAWKNEVNTMKQKRFKRKIQKNKF